jgi:cyclohexa-1,5-dienecarbonyl-CoA hydratase
MKLGVFAPAASVLLPLRIGQARAEDLLYSGRSIDAQTALAWGLANGVAEDPSALALEFFEKNLSDKSAASMAHAVRAAREPFAQLARARLRDVEALYLDDLMATRDANEGLNAFIEKRPPKWEHR